MVNPATLNNTTTVLLPADNEEFTMETRDASPSHLLVKIESFSLLSKNGIEKYESREFEAGGHKWRLVIYPDGDEIGKKSGHISVYLSIVDTDLLPVDWEVNAMFNFFLFNQILDNYTCFRGKVRRFHGFMNTKRGFPKFISKKSFTDTSNGYLVEDNCMFGAEVFVIKSRRVIERVSVGKVATPYKHDLVIPHFSKFDPKGVWISNEFSAGDYRWKIFLYPNGNGIGEGRCVSIFLLCVDSASFAPHEKVKVGACIRLKNKNHDKHCIKKVSQWFSSSTPGWGHTEFMKIGDMRDPVQGFVVDDSCYLETEISIKVVVRNAPKLRQ